VIIAAEPGLVKLSQRHDRRNEMRYTRLPDPQWDSADTLAHLIHGRDFAMLTYRAVTEIFGSVREKVSSERKISVVGQGESVRLKRRESFRNYRTSWGMPA
jgi:hypothetical protein